MTNYQNELKNTNSKWFDSVINNFVKILDLKDNKYRTIITDKQFRAFTSNMVDIDRRNQYEYINDNYKVVVHPKYSKYDKPSIVITDINLEKYLQAKRSLEIVLSDALDGYILFHDEMQEIKDYNKIINDYENK